MLSVTSDEDRVGGSMVFAGAQSVTTWQADNDTNGGFLVSAGVNFDDLTSGATAAILAKSDAGGFALEQAGTLLRGGVYVNGGYQYATARCPRSMARIRTSSSAPMTATARCGSGSTTWSAPPSVSVTGGVGLNTSLIVIGADPQGATDRRYFFKGKVQQVMVQRWRNH